MALSFSGYSLRLLTVFTMAAFLFSCGNEVSEAPTQGAGGMDSLTITTPQLESPAVYENAADFRTHVEQMQTEVNKGFRQFAESVHRGDTMQAESQRATLAKQVDEMLSELRTMEKQSGDTVLPRHAANLFSFYDSAMTNDLSRLALLPKGNDSAQAILKKISKREQELTTELHQAIRSTEIMQQEMK